MRERAAKGAQQDAQATATSLARRIADAGGGSVRAILLYGSQLLRTRPDEHSAYDIVVVVSDYRSFHRALHEAGELQRPVWLMTWLAGVLPPNNIAFAPDDGREGLAKCQIVSRAHFERALGSHPPDHFLLGRMVQRVATLWAATSADEEWVADQLAGARDRVLDWMAPYLDEPVDAAGLGRRLLEVCYAGEFRPEARDRAHRIFDAQADHFREVFPSVLEEGVRMGLLRREGDRYALARPVPASERKRWRRHFALSKARATTRWFKHVVTFANWLPYIVRKVERHTGRSIELTPLERKLPLIFLWPRAIHVLLSRPKREIES